MAMITGLEFIEAAALGGEISGRDTAGAAGRSSLVSVEEWWQRRRQGHEYPVQSRKKSASELPVFHEII